MFVPAYKYRKCVVISDDLNMIYKIFLFICVFFYDSD